MLVWIRHANGESHSYGRARWLSVGAREVAVGVHPGAQGFISRHGWKWRARFNPEHKEWIIDEVPIEQASKTPDSQ